MIAKKLDRFIFKGDLTLFENLFSAKILASGGSDHFPVQLSIVDDQRPRKCPFKFEKMWMQDINFLTLVKEWWFGMEVVGSRMFCFNTKIKILKQKLIQSNKDHFKNIFTEKERLEGEIEILNEEVIRSSMNHDNFYKEKKYYEGIRRCLN